MATPLYCHNDEGIDHTHRRAFVDMKSMVVYSNGASYTQKALDTKIIKFSLDRVLSKQTPFKVRIFLHLLMVVGNFFAKSRLFLYVAK